MINNKTVCLTVLLVLFAFGLIFVSVNTQSVLAQSSTATKCPKCAGSSATGTNTGVNATTPKTGTQSNPTGAGQKCPKC